MVLVLVVAFLNSLIVRYLPASVKVPESVAEEVAEYLVPETNISVEEGEKYLVTNVVDGDTIDIEIDGITKRVRYIGVDTPERAQKGNVSECFYMEATNRNKELVLGKTVTLVKDISEVDKYGRLLRYVYVNGELINLKLIEEGYGRFVTFPPDVAKVPIFRDAERKSRNERIGLWGDSCL